MVAIANKIDATNDKGRAVSEYEGKRFTCNYIYIYICVCMCMCMCVCVYFSVCMCVCVYVGMCV